MEEMKIEVQNFKKSIYDIGLSRECEAILWDFYVTKAMCASASQRRKIEDNYGHKNIPWKKMLDIAKIADENKVVLLANSINETLHNHDLETTQVIDKNKCNKAIDINIPKLVCLTPYTIADDNPPKAKAGEAESVLTHIRNSFAHGNTYIFDNQNILLEDKDQRGTITARIIIRVQTLFDWINIIDNEQRYYTVPENIWATQSER